MGQTELFILFPVYEETDNVPFYLKKMTTPSAEEFKVYIQRMDEVLKYTLAESVNFYHDSENVRNFLYPIDTMPNEYPKLSTILLSILSKRSQNWRDNQEANELNSISFLNHRISNDTLNELYVRKRNNFDSVYAVLSNDAILVSKNPIEINVDRQIVPVTILPTSGPSLILWLSENRIPQRVFNFNPKHGEYGVGAHSHQKGQPVSILRCGREEACTLLKRAIGEDDKHLFAYDSNNSSFVKFFKESPLQYHGFHLDELEQKKMCTFIRDLCLNIEHSCKDDLSQT